MHSLVLLPKKRVIMRTIDPLDELIAESLQAAYGEEAPTNRPYERLMARVRKETMPRLPAPVLFLAGALLLVFLLMPPDVPSSSNAADRTPPVATDPSVQSYVREHKPSARIPLAWLLAEPIGVDDGVQTSVRREAQ